MERPKEVAAFEWLFLAAIALGVVGAIIDWELLAADPLLLTVIALSLIVTLLLVIGTSRFRSNVSRWILTVLTVIGVAMSAGTLGVTTLTGLLATVTALLQVLALFLLFTEPARTWFAAPATDTQPEEPGPA
ncbi:MAG: hypothetical protein ACK4K7_05245 [Allosphingosinicella sp.]|uniref:hypothetical protein n=1 Tax=Allosphingosinicella sp. TaxID=2823234 RepID=UPI00395D6B5E